MKVEILDGLGRPSVLPASRVLVTFDDGTPAMLALEWMPGQITAGHLGEASFRAMLKNCGVDRTVVTDVYRPRPLAEILAE